MEVSKMACPNNNENIQCDVLILGSGIAGLTLAHELTQFGMRIVLACKGSLLDSNTAWAQGGIAAVTGANPLDTPEQHLEDTLSAGAGLTDPVAAALIIGRGREAINKLSSLGVQFDRTNGSFDTALEGGHSRSRVLHSKDASGKAIAMALAASLRANNRVTILEELFALDLLVLAGRCAGVSALSGKKQIQVVAAHTVLATGGLGQVFARTTNPEIATGDGIAMAYRAGARVVDMEFVQFHPTALMKDGAPAALISEAVRGAGAHLLDSDGQRFAFRFHKDGELATRDVVSRAIFKTIIDEGSKSVRLDMRPIGSEKIIDRFPNIVASCRKWGIDPLVEPIPISPAAHYFMGGIWTDVCGRSSLPGLYAIGECASLGLHGANRLASNSLLEGAVMAMVVAQHIADQPLPSRSGIQARMKDIERAYRAPHSLPRDLSLIKRTMFENAGLQRDAAGLQQIISSMPKWCDTVVLRDRATAEAANIALLGSLIASSALERKESRGAHWRSDFPKTDDLYLKRYFMSREGCGWLEVQTPIPALKANASGVLA
jgi:L-aspartate oxidase